MACVRSWRIVDPEEWKTRPFRAGFEAAKDPVHMLYNSICADVSGWDEWSAGSPRCSNSGQPLVVASNNISTFERRPRDRPHAIMAFFVQRQFFNEEWLAPSGSRSGSNLWKVEALTMNWFLGQNKEVLVLNHHPAGPLDHVYVWGGMYLIVLGVTANAACIELVQQY
jgi:hypothetical protein